MTFGLKNAPGTFKMAMEVILASIKRKFALFYLDDVEIFSNTPGDHIYKVK